MAECTWASSLTEVERFETFLSATRDAFESAVDLARQVSPVTAALDPDDLIGPAQQLRFTFEEHRRVLSHEVPVVERTLLFSGDDASYKLTFALRERPRWGQPTQIIPAGSAHGGKVGAASRFAEHLDLFWVGTDGGIGIRSWYDNQWHPPTQIIPARSAAGGVAAVSRFAEHLDLFWVGTDDGIGIRSWYDGP